MQKEKLVNINLIPVCEYPETIIDHIKYFTCSRCARVFTQKNGPRGVKQHIAQVHIANGELQLRQATVPESTSKAQKIKAQIEVNMAKQ